MYKVSLHGLVSFCVCLGMCTLVSCGKKTGEQMAKMEEDFMTSHYKDKMDRPSPPARTEATIGKAKVSLEYSQPAVKGRKIWGGLEKYDKIWRTGANEANVLQTSHPLLLNGDTIPVGKFSLFTIPKRDEWIVIINKDFDQWGVYNYNESLDVTRVLVVPQKVSDLKERMTFELDQSGDLSFSWEYLRFSLNLKPLN
ncbi:MAG: DUF2911 domain-containing protein [Cyclobacteriaceae bacterium]